jgi:DNA repair protein RadC
MRRIMGEAFTTKLVGIGEALGVEILDPLIVTTSSFLSFKDRGFL